MSVAHFSSNGHSAERTDLRLVADKQLFPDLDKIEGRPDDGALDHLDASLTPKGRILSSVNSLEAKRALETARARGKQTRFLLADAEARAAEAEQRFALTKPQNFCAMALNSIVAIMALGCDVGFTWLVLPTLLNVPPRSVLGVALGCTPLVATVVIKEIFEKLFDFLGFYRGKPESSWARRIAETAEHLLYAGVFGLNVAMLVKLALGREEAMKILQAVMDLSSNASVPPLDLMVLSSLVIWVGLVAVLDSALVIQKLLKQAHESVQRRTARRDLAIYQKQVTERHRELAEAEAHEEVEAAFWEMREQRAQAFEEALQRRDRAQLAQIRSRQRPAGGLAEIVEEAYSRALTNGNNGAWPTTSPDAVQ